MQCLFYLVPGVQIAECGSQMVGTELNHKWGEKKEGRMGREQGNACKHSKLEHPEPPLFLFSPQFFSGALLSERLEQAM